MKARSISTRLLVATVGITACHKGGEVPPAQAPPEARVIVEAPPPRSATRAESPPPATTLATDPPSPKAPWQLKLEVDATRLAPVPSPNPAQYRSWRQLARISVGKSHLDTALITDDGVHLVVMSGAEATVRAYTMKSRRLIGNYSVAGFRAGSWDRGEVATWPDLDRGPAFVVGNSEGLHVYSLLSGAHLAQLHGDPIWNLRWTDDRSYLVATTHDLQPQTSVLRVFRRAPGPFTPVATIAADERVDDLAISRDNRLAAIVTYPSDTLKVIDLGTGEALWSRPAPQYSGTVHFSPDGTRVAVGGAAVQVFEIADPDNHASYSKLGNNVDKVRFSPSGDAIAASTYDGHCRVLSSDPSARALKLLADLRHAGTSNVYAVSFSADGRRLVTSSGDKTVRIWGR